jgi:hypothetical protein
MGNLRHNQRGMTFIGWLIILGIIGFFVLLLLRLTPTYLENFTVKQQLKSLSEESGVGELPPVQIRGKLLARFSIDDVTNVPVEAIKVNKNQERVVIDISYHVRTPLFGNIDALVTFNEHVEFPVR